jgi:hypothetical protein
MQKDGAVLPIIFSQTDIETMDIQAPVRISLIDSFNQTGSPPDRQSELISNISSLTAQMQNLKREIEGFDNQLMESQQVRSKLDSLALQESAMAATSASIQQQQSELRTLSDQASRFQIASDAAQRTVATLTEFLNRLQGVPNYPPLLEPPTPGARAC